MLTYFYTKKFIRVRFEWDTTYIKKILRESLPYGVALFLGAIFFKVDTILLSILESPEVADIAVALYALPMKLVEVGMMYGMIFLTSTLPIMTRQSHEKDTEGMQRTISQAFEVLFAF
jgi:O-antigen/teichoic acid export membrane protein